MHAAKLAIWQQHKMLQLHQQLLTPAEGLLHLAPLQ
jgi:hypothetical protein